MQSNDLANSMYFIVRSVINSVSIDDCAIVLSRHQDVLTEIHIYDRLYELCEELIKLRDCYIIRNKDEILGVVDWSIFNAPTLVEDFGLPKYISEDVYVWLTSRTPPKHRANMKRLLEECGLEGTRDIIDYSNGLSLTDTLWVAKSSFDKGWETVSLFRNEFDETIARIAFDGGVHGLPFSTTSPEFGTDGMLPKCWTRDNGVIYLIKGGTSGACNAGREPYSEVLAHQVLDILEYSHVPYTVEYYHGHLVSRCKLMTSEMEMLLPIYRYYNFKSIGSLMDMCRKDGISIGLAQHLVFDYLSWNTDRHAGNLGVILDADTFELKSFAPIFDNGMSMLNYWTDAPLDEYVKSCPPALYPDFEYGAVLGKRELGSKHNVQRLINFKFDHSLTPGFPEDRLRVIENWLQTRVQAFLSM